MRFFVNTASDFVPGTTVNIAKDVWKQNIRSICKSIFERMPASDFKNSNGGLYVGSAGVAFMYYYLSHNVELQEDHNDFIEKAVMYSKFAVKFGRQGGYRNDPPASFILGQAGVDAVAAFVASSVGQSPDKYLTQYAEAATKCKQIDFFRNGSDELFVGRAGYLCGILNLEKKLGIKVVSDDVIHQLCAVTVESGRRYAQRHKSPSPLMYAYYKTEYLGAAHGLCSILQMLLSFPSYLKSDPGAEKDIRGAVDFILGIEQANYNYVPAMDEVGAQNRPDSEELVHWCHGAPGIVYLFARAYLVWKDEKYLQVCVRCGELTWRTGLLRKGPGICHGVAGSGYVFLLLYRLTSDPKYLHRAVKFAEFLFTAEFQQGVRIPDSPFSLYEGWAGTVCFLADLLQPDISEFPFFNVFVG